jgi:hypothetical protein
LRALVAKALSGDMRRARRFLKLCQEAGSFEVPEEVDDHQYVLRIPKDWDHDEWLAMYDQLGPPPWPGDRDGLVRHQREQ